MMSVSSPAESALLSYCVTSLKQKCSEISAEASLLTLMIHLS